MPIHPIYARRLPDEVKARLVADADRILPETIERGGRLGTQLNCVDILDQLEPPVLLANGIYEKGFQPDAARVRREHPSWKVADLQGGHAVNIEAADGFDAAVIEFYSQSV